LEKVWNLFESGKVGENDDEAMKLLHKSIKKIGEDVENYKFNTAIAQLMILVNY
jgi:leucyl-tRNA synthetase